LTSSTHPLVELMHAEDLLGEANWNKRHVLLKNAIAVSEFLQEDELLAAIERPLLRKPYFSVFKEGVWVRPEKIARTRKLNGQTVEGLASAAGIRAALAEGCTLKLNQMEDWHQPTRSLVRQIEAMVPAEVKAYTFYTPADNTGMLPHRDGSHVIAVQISGKKIWRLYVTPEHIDARPGGVDVDPAGQTHEFVMEPGDVLYLPHGYPHAATTAQGAPSLHVTLTLTEPGPLELLQGLLETLQEDSSYLVREHHRFALTDKGAAVAGAITKHLKTVPSDRVIASALQGMRRRVVDDRP